MSYEYNLLKSGDGFRMEMSERFAGTFAGMVQFDPEDGSFSIAEPDASDGESLISPEMKQYYESKAYKAYIKSIQDGHPIAEPPQPKIVPTGAKKLPPGQATAQASSRNVVQGVLIASSGTQMVEPFEPGSAPSFSFEKVGGAYTGNSLNLHLGGKFVVESTALVVDQATFKLRPENNIETVDQMSFPKGETELSSNNMTAKPLIFSEQQILSALQTPTTGTLSASASYEYEGETAKLTLTIQLRDPPCTGMPSGGSWCGQYCDTRSTSELSDAFRPKAEAFLAALWATKKVSVSLGSCRRPKERAYLMHWAWMIAKEGFDESQVPKMPGVDICWTHRENGVPSHPLAMAKAAEMVAGYHLSYKPSLTSRHITGDAIDVTLAWGEDFEIVDGQGKSVMITGPRSGAENTFLHEVGATYGVIKLVADAPHWSVDGS